MKKQFKIVSQEEITELEAQLQSLEAQIEAMKLANYNLLEKNEILQNIYDDKQKND